MMPSFRTILFDLDGTLADTAPDLADALNRLLQEQGQEALPFDTIRPYVSHGTPALLKLGFGMATEHADFAPLRQRILDLYIADIATRTTLFDGMSELLAWIEDMGMNWGVVTNKPDFLTRPLMGELGLLSRAVTIVSGDTLPERKPHPAPMLHAAREAGSPPNQCLYVGDALRDIEAGRAAGMKTVAARYGYLGTEEAPEAWQADHIIDHPLQLISWLQAQSTSKAS